MRLSVAGSAAVNVLSDTTLAYIAAGAIVNATDGSPGTGPGVMVTAADLLNLLSTGGAAAVGGSAGFGAGVDVDSITKNTQAYIATANVLADGDVLVEAFSAETLTSITASVGLGGEDGVAGSASVYVLTITTRAFIGDDPSNPTTGATNVQASGSMLVSASDSTALDILVGQPLRLRCSEHRRGGRRPGHHQDDRGLHRRRRERRRLGTGQPDPG